MPDLLLKHQFTDRFGRDVYNIVDPDEEDIVLGQLKMTYGKDEGYRDDLRVEWDADITDPTARAESQ